MNSNKSRFQDDFSIKTMNIDIMIETLDQIHQDLHSPNLKKRVDHIEDLLISFRDLIETEETRYRQLEEKRKRLVKEERYRTSYNPSTDGRIKGANYAGQGDMGIRRGT